MRRVEINKTRTGTTYLYENGHVSIVNNRGEESARYLTLKKGYLTIRVNENLRRVDKSVHRLVATHFLPEDQSGIRHHVNHKNGIKTDNRAENLEWCTPKENNIHARDVLNAYNCIKWLKISTINLDIIEECVSTQELKRNGVDSRDITGKSNNIWVTEDLYMEGEEAVREYIRKKSPKYTGKGLRKYSNVIVANIKRLSKESTLNTRDFAKSVGIDRKMIRSMVNGKYEDTSHHTCGLCYYSGILKI